MVYVFKQDKYKYTKNPRCTGQQPIRHWFPPHFAGTPTQPREILAEALTVWREAPFSAAWQWLGTCLAIHISALLIQKKKKYSCYFFKRTGTHGDLAGSSHVEYVWGAEGNTGWEGGRGNGFFLHQVGIGYQWTRCNDVRSGDTLSVS